LYFYSFSRCPVLEFSCAGLFDLCYFSDQCKKLKVISLAPLLAQAILRIHWEKSLSVLFEKNAKSQAEALEEAVKKSSECS